MDSGGRIYDVTDEADARRRGLTLVQRNLTDKEKADQQIRLYSPCGCGSGKKFKFCHFQRAAVTVTASEAAK